MIKYVIVEYQYFIYHTNLYDTYYKSLVYDGIVKVHCIKFLTVVINCPHINQYIFKLSLSSFNFNQMFITRSQFVVN